MIEPSNPETVVVSKVDVCLRGMPRTLKIGAYDWSIVLEDTEEELCGQADFENHRIRLWPKSLKSPSHVVGIAFHECLHVIYDNHDLVKLKRDKEEREEMIVMGFEAGMISLFRDNPKFVTWMKKWLR
jgi:hypothetical protein